MKRNILQLTIGMCMGIAISGIVYLLVLMPGHLNQQDAKSISGPNQEVLEESAEQAYNFAPLDKKLEEELFRSGKSSGETYYQELREYLGCESKGVKAKAAESIFLFCPNRRNELAADLWKIIEKENEPSFFGSFAFTILKSDESYRSKLDQLVSLKQQTVPKIKLEYENRTLPAFFAYKAKQNAVK